MNLREKAKAAAEKYAGREPKVNPGMHKFWKGKLAGCEAGYLQCAEDILSELVEVIEILSDDCGYQSTCGCASCRALAKLQQLKREVEG